MKDRLENLKSRVKYLRSSIKKVEDLAVVSCYFNPLNYKSRLENYKIFRESITKTKVRFLTVELAFGEDSFHLSEFPEVLKIRTNKDNIMWQKERLLNIGIKKLIDEGYQKIAWLDADIVFDNPSWPEMISKCLDEENLCQVFSSVYRDENSNNVIKYIGSARYQKEKNKLSIEESRCGFGWAAKTEILKKCLLYDKIIASPEADALIFLGSFFSDDKKKKGILNSDVISRLNPELRKDYISWAEEWGRLIEGKVGYIKTDIHALYHGDIRDRNYQNSSQIYKKYNFNPKKDLEIRPEGCYSLEDSKQEMRDEIKKYFISRNEDRRFEINPEIQKENDLAIVCCHFNPCKYKSRVENYKIFRNEIIKIGVRFLTVELSFGEEPFELNYPEVIHLRTSEENIMWQKERLLNIGIRQLINEGYKKISWLDADIVFEDYDWHQKVSDCLDKFNVCQVFSEAYKLDENGIENQEIGCIKNYSEINQISIKDVSPGFGWAARSEILKKIPLYESCIVAGENDSLIFFASLFQSEKNKIKVLDSHLVKSRLNPKMKNHFIDWAKKWSELVEDKVGYSENRIKVLHHGKMENRKYVDSHKIYWDNEYNPLVDISGKKEGPLTWNTDKPNLHSSVKEYFQSRDEDETYND